MKRENNNEKFTELELDEIAYNAQCIGISDENTSQLCEMMARSDKSIMQDFNNYCHNSPRVHYLNLNLNRVMLYRKMDYDDLEFAIKEIVAHTLKGIGVSDRKISKLQNKIIEDEGKSFWDFKDDNKVYERMANLYIKACENKNPHTSENLPKNFLKKYLIKNSKEVRTVLAKNQTTL